MANRRADSAQWLRSRERVSIGRWRSAPSGSWWPRSRALVRAVVAGGPDLSQRVAAFHHRIEAMIARALRGNGGGAPPNELERRVGQALVNVWFASLTGWASGLHGVDAIVEDTRSAAD